jgi:hypothetical protein
MAAIIHMDDVGVAQDADHAEGQAVALISPKPVLTSPVQATACSAAPYVAFAALSGLVFGYDMCIIGGEVPLSSHSSCLQRLHRRKFYNGFILPFACNLPASKHRIVMLFYCLRSRTRPCSTAF